MVNQKPQVFQNIGLGGHCKETHVRDQEAHLTVRYEKQGLYIIPQGRISLHQRPPTLDSGQSQVGGRTKKYIWELLLVSYRTPL